MNEAHRPDISSDACQSLDAATGLVLRKPRRRVLIVEDEMFVAWHLETLVQELKLDVCGMVPDGESAIIEATDYNPDLILMDINLSGAIDGIEAARQIHVRQSTPIIFVTAHGDSQTLARLHESVPNAQVIVKPILSHRLQAAIATVLKE